MTRFFVVKVLAMVLAGVGPVARAWGQGRQTVVLRPRPGPTLPVTATLRVDSVQPLAAGGLVLTLTLHNPANLALALDNPLYDLRLRIYDSRGRLVYRPPITRYQIICSIDGRNYKADEAAGYLPLAWAWMNRRPVNTDPFYQQRQVRLPAHGTLGLVVRVPKMYPHDEAPTYPPRLRKLAADRYRLQLGLAFIRRPAPGKPVQVTRLDATPLSVD